MKTGYRITTTLLGFAAIMSAFFLHMFSFTINATLTAKTYNFSIYTALSKLMSSGISSDSISSADALKEAIGPMYGDAIKFFVLLIIALVFILSIIILSAATRLHVPQAVLSGLAVILLVIAAGFGSRALGCLIADPETGEAKVSLINLITASGLATDNKLLALGVGLGAGLNLIKIMYASISYGLYVIIAIMIFVFIYSIIAASRANSDQPVKVHKKHHKEYRRKKPMRKIF